MIKTNVMIDFLHCHCDLPNTTFDDYITSYLKLTKIRWDEGRGSRTTDWYFLSTIESHLKVVISSLLVCSPTHHERAGAHTHTHTVLAAFPNIVTQQLFLFVI